MVGIIMLNLVTKRGELDVNFTPSGTSGYDDLHTGATTFDVGRVPSPRRFPGRHHPVEDRRRPPQGLRRSP